METNLTPIYRPDMFEARDNEEALATFQQKIYAGEDVRLAEVAFKSARMNNFERASSNRSVAIILDALQDVRSE